MASTTMTTLSLSGIILSGKQYSTNSRRRGLIVAKASNAPEVEPTKLSYKINSSNENMKENNNNGRRELMFAAVAAAACSLAGVAFAGEPKAGTVEAKKAYAPVCVTMPTARICRN